jgi:hypothetical protein
MPLSLLLLSLWLGTAATARPLPAAGVTHREQVAARYALGHGLQATVAGHTLVIKNASGTIIARNEQIIRLADENSSCPSEGFERIVAKGDYFTIKQQTCGGWSFIQEYITFHYVPASGQLMLHKYGRVATDRRDPNKIIPANVYTTKQLGQHPLAQVTKAALDAME